MAGTRHLEHSFDDFVKELKRDSPPTERKKGGKKRRKYFLIVCEGERTEPNYFESKRMLLPKSVVNTVAISGIGENTINVVEKAIELRDARNVDPTKPNYNEVWAVFDKDDFTDERVNRAVQLADDNSIKPCLSNESFELWYVLHFQYLDVQLKRDDYVRILKEKLGSYKKNDHEIYNAICRVGSEDHAIKHAKRLDKTHKDESPADSFPSTDVYKLVKSLNKYIEKD